MNYNRSINKDKGDGKPYVDMLEKEYKKMNDKQKAEVDTIGKKLNDIFKIQDDEK